MTRWWPFAAVALAIVVAGGVLAVWWDTGPAPCANHEPAEVDELTPSDVDRCVTLEGQAHYDVVVKQTFPGTLFTAERTRYLFPLFPPSDTDDRAIRVLLMTAYAPEDLVSYETMRVSGRVVPLNHRDVPPGTEVQMGQRSNYFFADTMVLLVPDRVESDGAVWERP